MPVEVQAHGHGIDFWASPSHVWAFAVAGSLGAVAAAAPRDPSHGAQGCGCVSILAWLLAIASGFVFGPPIPGFAASLGTGGVLGYVFGLASRHAIVGDIGFTEAVGDWGGSVVLDRELGRFVAVLVAFVPLADLIGSTLRSVWAFGLCSGAVALAAFMVGRETLRRGPSGPDAKEAANACLARTLGAGVVRLLAVFAFVAALVLLPAAWRVGLDLIGRPLPAKTTLERIEDVNRELSSGRWEGVGHRCFTSQELCQGLGWSESCEAEDAVAHQYCAAPRYGPNILAGGPHAQLRSQEWRSCPTPRTHRGWTSAFPSVIECIASFRARHPGREATVRDVEKQYGLDEVPELEIDWDVQYR